MNLDANSDIQDIWPDGPMNLIPAGALHTIALSLYPVLEGEYFCIARQSQSARSEGHFRTASKTALKTQGGIWEGKDEGRKSCKMKASFTIKAALLSAVLTARLILNMREVTDTDSMAVGDVSSVEASTVEWNDIDGIPMEDTRGHVRNRASRGYGNYFE
ncbi:hypothetical protein B0H14DRAFT_2617286 [Mycena olivaceomarginata]|nr:hypothetical protein B0H14DRAFT_2617286 [Mycena olivaceomarginata]